MNQSAASEAIRVDFYVDAQDKLLFCCELLHKISKLGQRVLVYGEGELIDELDFKLWTFAQQSFLPHCRVDDELASQTPVLLTTYAVPNPGVDCLLQLARDIPQHWQGYPRILEALGRDETDKMNGRRRYKMYREQGCTMANHQLTNKDIS